MHGEAIGEPLLWVAGWGAFFLIVFAPLTMHRYNGER